MDGFLSSWKEIAAFFWRGVRNVQRWEQSFGLPVHRPSMADRNIIFAKASELEAWVRGEHGVDEIRTVLVFTEDQGMRNLLSEFLENAGYPVFRCSTSERVREICERGPSFHLLIADYPVNAEARRNLLDEVSAHRPGARVLFLGGPEIEPVPERAGGGIISANLSKPFELAGFHALINQLFASESANPEGLISSIGRKQKKGSSQRRSKLLSEESIKSFRSIDSTEDATFDTN
jgi:DNA-binding NarL/FixJ family response regulator